MKNYSTKKPLRENKKKQNKTKVRKSLWFCDRGRLNFQAFAWCSILADGQENSHGLKTLPIFGDLISYLSYFSIYTLSDLGNSSNLIG